MQGIVEAGVFFTAFQGYEWYLDLRMLAPIPILLVLNALPINRFKHLADNFCQSISTMSSDNLIAFQSPEPTETFHDSLSELVCTGACQIIRPVVN